MTQKLIDTLERDIRNQVLIDSFLKLNRRQRFMIALNRFNWILMTGIVFCVLFWLALGSLVLADPLSPAGSNATGEPPKFPCPDVTPCKVLTITATEERLLTGQNGILDTAAQGRALELGQFSVYLKTRIASAPAGEPQKPLAPPAPPVEQPRMQPTPNQMAPTNNSADPVDKK